MLIGGYRALDRRGILHHPYSGVTPVSDRRNHEFAVG
jgi:hypothetical protein